MAQPIITYVVAMARNRVIGRDGALPWHLPADLRRFKSVTMGKPIVMGRKTYESIGHPLPGRSNIVVTRNPAYRADGCIVVDTSAAALSAVPADEFMVIGGAELFREMLPRADRIDLTEVDADVPGDTWFPAMDMQAWREISREPHPADARHAFPYSFVVLERIRAP